MPGTNVYDMLPAYVAKSEKHAFDCGRLSLGFSGTIARDMQLWPEAAGQGDDATNISTSFMCQIEDVPNSYLQMQGGGIRAMPR